MQEHPEYDRLKKELAVNPEDLEADLARQVLLYQQTAEYAALAKQAELEARRLYDETEAQFIEELRDSLTTQNQKPTETRLKYLVLEQPNVKSKYREYIQARLGAELWYGLQDAYKQRGYMIREAVQLHLTYWAPDSIQKRQPRSS